MDTAQSYPEIAELLNRMLKERASDLYLTHGAVPSFRVDEHIVRFDCAPLNDVAINHYLDTLLTPTQRDEFDTTLEFNTAIPWGDSARFRINVFRQQQHNGVVIRTISTQIPTIEELELPKVYSDLIMQKRGLVLVVGPTGSGKTTSLAAMIGYRNQHGYGHIVTIEDPIEYVHAHGNCIVNQRDVGIDTYSYGMALKNALRQRPDVIVIGEVRDRETMEHAISFAETGHLCVATLHSNNANQTIERILNFFPEEKHIQVLANLSLNLRGIVSQRLVATRDDKKRALALEIMLNNGLIKQLIEEGKVRNIKEMIERGQSDGMCTMDQSLLELFKAGVISQETAIAEADNGANMRLSLRQMSGAEIRTHTYKISRVALKGQEDF
jgi:twitching motility protein PilU